jgi:hypothetical protein
MMVPKTKLNPATAMVIQTPFKKKGILRISS